MALAVLKSGEAGRCETSMIWIGHLFVLWKKGVFQYEILGLASKCDNSIQYSIICVRTAREMDCILKSSFSAVFIVSLLSIVLHMLHVKIM